MRISDWSSDVCSSDLAEQVGRRVFQAVSDQARLALLAGQHAAKGIVEVDYPTAQPGHLEQARLGSTISIHAAVVIEVVPRQIGEHGDIEIQGRDAPLIETMRRHFHRYRASTLLFEVRQCRLHADGVRRGVASQFQLSVESGAKRADDSAGFEIGRASGRERVCQYVYI